MRKNLDRPKPIAFRRILGWFIWESNLPKQHCCRELSIPAASLSSIFWNYFTLDAYKITWNGELDCSNYCERLNSTAGLITKVKKAGNFVPYNYFQDKDRFFVQPYMVQSQSLFCVSRNYVCKNMFACVMTYVDRVIGLYFYCNLRVCKSLLKHFTCETNWNFRDMCCPHLHVTFHTIVMKEKTLRLGTIVYIDYVFKILQIYNEKISTALCLYL